jgi:hypothetical protein
MKPDTEESRLWAAIYCASVEGQRASRERSMTDSEFVSEVAADDATAAVAAYRRKVAVAE